MQDAQLPAQQYSSPSPQHEPNIQVQNSTALLNLLRLLAPQIASQTSFEELIAHAVDLINTHLKYDYVALYIKEWGQLVCYGKSDVEHLLTDDIAAYITDNQKTFITDDLSNTQASNSAATKTKMQSQVCVPIMQFNQVAGFLDVQGPDIKMFDTSDVYALEMIADQIAIAMQNADLHESLESVYHSLQDELKKREEAQAQLHSNELRLNGIIQSASDAIVSIDASQVIILANEATGKMFDYTTSELIGQPLTILMPENLRAHHEKHVSTFSKTGVSSRRMSGETKLFGRKADGTTFPIEAMISQTIISGEPVLTAIVRDISEREAASLAVKKERDFILHMMNTVAEGIVVHDETGKIILCNAASGSILGLTQDQLMGKTSVDPAWHTIRADGSPFDGNEHPAVITLQTGKPCHQVSMGVYKPDGSLTWITINSRPLFLEGGIKPHSVVVSFSDVSALKEVEAHFRESEFRFRTLTEQSPDLILIIDTQTEKLQYSNNALPETLPPKPLDQITIDDLFNILFDPTDKHAIKQNWNQIMQGEIDTTTPVECRMHKNVTDWERGKYNILCWHGMKEDGRYKLCASSPILHT